MMTFISGASCATACAAIKTQGACILCALIQTLPRPHPQLRTLSQLGMPPLPSRHYFIRQPPPTQRISSTMTLTHSDPTSTSAHAESHTDIDRNANTRASTDTRSRAYTDASAEPTNALLA